MSLRPFQYHKEPPNVELVSGFLAKDSTGKLYNINVWQEYIDATTLGDSLEGITRRVEGFRHLETHDGEPVDRHEKGRYTIYRKDGTQIEVTSDFEQAE